MATYHVLYNPNAGNGRGKPDTEKLKELMAGDTLNFYDMTAIADYRAFFAEIPEGDRLMIAGGDGTLNRFVNDTREMTLPGDLYYYATGSGNDFLHDLGKSKGDAPFCINQYVRDLPSVTVNGKEYLFLNGIGYGIDGYCCEVGDKKRAKSDKPVNYTSIAIKGLLFFYRRANATVIVDGKEYRYRKTWLAPTMNGRFYGGGMMTAPGQDRLNADHSLSVVAMYGSNKLKTLMVFPSIFKGEHVNHTEMVEVHTGHDITVKFDRPTALQIDGETVLGVTEYTVKAFRPACVKA